MKNSLASNAIKRIGSALRKSLPTFDEQHFISQANANIETLELKARVEHLIAVLHQHLPVDFESAAAILLTVKEHWDYGKEDDSYSVFAAWPIIDYVAVYGLEHPETSLATLKSLTSLFSAEFAIRPFIVKYPEYCLSQFTLWLEDDCEHVRRLISEGTRPRLPWGLRLNQFINDPAPNLPLLSALKTDSSLYVRRSVANHLNDIAKDHPEIVVTTCKAWQKYCPKNSELQWVIKHATRTLVKQGNSGALALLGFTESPKVKVGEIGLSSAQIKQGDNIEFSFSLESLTSEQQNLVIDYAMYFIKANGKQSAKVFKLKNCILSGHEQLSFSKKHSFKKISTRKYYPGEHTIEILVNGQATSAINFTLL